MTCRIFSWAESPLLTSVKPVLWPCCVFQVAKAVSHSLNNCVNCLPGQKDVDMALRSIGEASKKLLIETVSLWICFCVFDTFQQCSEVLFNVRVILVSLLLPIARFVFYHKSLFLRALFRSLQLPERFRRPRMSWAKLQLALTSQQARWSTPPGAPAASWPRPLGSSATTLMSFWMRASKWLDTHRLGFYFKLLLQNYQTSFEAQAHSLIFDAMMRFRKKMTRCRWLVTWRTSPWLPVNYCWLLKVCLWTQQQQMPKTCWLLLQGTCMQIHVYKK